MNKQRNERIIKTTRALALIFTFALWAIALIVLILGPQQYKSSASLSLAITGTILTAFLAGWKELLPYGIVVTIALALMFYINFLNRTLSGIDILGILFSSSLGIVVTLILCTALYAGLRSFLPNSFKRFATNLWKMLSIPGIATALLHFFVTYFIVAFVFSILYSSIYVFIGSNSFQATSSLQFSDFLYYSFFVPATLGFPDITPSHWLSRLVTLLEIGLGITIFVIYLGAIVGEITEHYSIISNSN
jgi:hypothetical protein